MCVVWTIITKHHHNDSTLSFILLPPLPSSTKFNQFSSFPNFSTNNNNNNNNRFNVRAIKDKTNPIETPSPFPSSAEDVTKKYGLEAGLWKIFSTKEDEEGNEIKSKANQAKELLAKYGGAYLATSITLSLISFTLCYVLVNAGVDVPALLQKVGIAPSETGARESRHICSSIRCSQSGVSHKVSSNSCSDSHSCWLDWKESR